MSTVQLNPKTSVPESSSTSLNVQVSKNRMLPLVSEEAHPRPSGKAAVLNLLKAGFLTISVFWVFCVWIYGALAGSGSRVDRLKGYIVDYDGGAIGQALLASLSTVSNPKTTLGWEVLPASRFTAEELTHEVYHGNVWAAIWVPAGASAAFNQTLSTPASAATYQATQAIYYASVETRYSTAYSAFIYPKILALAGAAEAILQQTTVLPLLSTLDSTALSAAQLRVLASPVSSTFINLAPLSFSTRVLLNTLGKVLPILFQFFFLMALNGIFGGGGMYDCASTSQLMKYRYPIKLVWGILSAASCCSFALIFHESDVVEFKWWLALFAATLVYCWISWDTVEIITAFVPLPFLTNFILPLIIVSVAACIFPLELSNNFYRIGYFIPAHSLWMIEIMIFGKGATGRNAKIYIPVLLAWLVVGEVAQVIALRKRSQDSFKQSAAH